MAGPFNYLMVVKTSVARTSFVEKKSVSYNSMPSSFINLNPFSFAMIYPLAEDGRLFRFCKTPLTAQ
ncbi:MAG: hypothetical protein AMK69_15840 [Nitrospira bacterium SG8_3]|nr:MAG: hypothetical protein AMK69_15840 [Nitrospira bacterium SG8_3]